MCLIQNTLCGLVPGLFLPTGLDESESLSLRIFYFKFSFIFSLNFRVFVTSRVEMKIEILVKGKGFIYGDGLLFRMLVTSLASL